MTVLAAAAEAVAVGAWEVGLLLAQVDSVFARAAGTRPLTSSGNLATRQNAPSAARK